MVRRGRETAGGRVPCRGGCTACCHGPFDISVADAELTDGGGATSYPPRCGRRSVVRAASLLDRMRAIEPAWATPYEIARTGEERFDRLTDALAGEPCPLLDDAGRCVVYDDRPLVCRMIGLGMVTPAGRVIENACPIQHQFPGYADAAADAVRARGVRGAARWSACGRRPSGASEMPERWGFETTIAAAVVEAGATEPKA